MNDEKIPFSQIFLGFPKHTNNSKEDVQQWMKNNKNGFNMIVILMIPCAYVPFLGGRGSTSANYCHCSLCSSLATAKPN